MNKIYLILIVASIFLAFSVEGRISRIIDDFTDTPYNARYVPSQAEVYDNTPPYDWFSPYNADVGLVPFTNFKNAANVIGGQRDIIVGHISNMQTAASISCSVNRANGNVPANFQLSLPTNFVGGIYLQWDGIDNATPAQGALLNKGIGSDNGIGSNADGTVDFTFGGAANGILISVQTDLPILYELKAINLADDTSNQGAGNNLDLTVQRNEITGFTRFYFTYADPEWSKTPAQFDWTKVAGFQLKVFTEEGAPTAQSLDSRIFLIQIGAFEVGGKVRADCLCDNLALANLSGISVQLYDTTPSVVLLETATTDANGDYRFRNSFTSSGGFIDGTNTYRICLTDATLSRCPNTQPLSANGCYSFQVTDPFIDQTSYDFTIAQTTQLSIPPNRDLECGVGDTTPTSTGFASATGCSGGNTQINTWSDSVTTSNCVRTIRRTWVDPETRASGTQVITITDTRPPTFSTPPQNLNQNCGDASFTTLSSWVSTNAGAVGTDACAFSRITNNWNQQQLNGCGSVSVSFTAVDVCGLTSAASSATYTVSSTSGPSFETAPSDLVIQCNFKQANLNPNTQITNWLNNHGGAVARDNCTTANALVWTENYSDTVITSTNACSFTETVTFSVRNSCNAVSTRAAAIRISDTTGPSITRPAADQTAQCSLTGSNDSAFQTWRNNHAGATATDDCVTNDASLTWTDTYTGGPISGSCDGTTTVTFIVSDSCGASSRTTATFRISDSVAPQITTQATNRESPCDGTGNVSDYNNWVATRGGAQATDNCGSVVWTNNAPANPPTGCNTPVSVTFTASQLCTPVLTAVTTATFRVIDNTPPTFSTPPQSQSVECSPTSQTAFTTWLANNAGAVGSDTCSNENLRITNNFSGSNLQNGCNNVATVAFTVRDNCNNPSTAVTATFTISDRTNPVIGTQASPQTVECNASTNTQAYSSWISSHGGATATDSCFTSLTWSVNDTTPIVPSCSTQRYITFTVADPCRNSATTVSSFTITDSQPPTLTRQASDRTVECTSGTDANSDLNSWLASHGGATATDNCGAVTWTNDFESLDPSCVSVNTVTFFASDSCQRMVSTTATFTYTDSQAPVITRQAQPTTVECSATNANAFQTFLDTHGGAQARDACSPAESLVWTNSFVSSPTGCSSSIVTFTVADLCGRTSQTTTTFAIVDTTKPVFSPPPDDITVQCADTNQADYENWIATHGNATVIDECAISITWTNNGTAPAPVGCGRRVVVFSAEDNCRNSVFATATFRVVDTVGPSFITIAQNQTVECSPTENTNQLNNFINSRAGATAIDACYGDQIIWSNNYNGVLSQSRCTQFAHVTFRAADPCGATSQTTATFTIVDSSPPTITQQATSASFECGPGNNDQIRQYLLTRGGASATDTCTAVTWTDNFISNPQECGEPIRVIFQAADVCGNVVQTFGSVEIIDSVTPQFLDFPEDISLGCDRGTDPDETGTPNGFDACDDEPSVTYFDVQVTLPDDLYCPGDIITYRTWVVTDNCGNVRDRQQIITTEFAFTSAPCTADECPTCRVNVCCPAVTDRVACNPVPCTPVACTTVGCTTVPCIPNTDCEVIYYPDDDGEPPVPQPSILPAPSCEPVYIYIFDDDGPEDPDVYRASSTNSSSSLVACVFLLLLSVLML